MATIDSLRRQVQVLRHRSHVDTVAKTWCLCLEANEEIPDFVLEKIQPQDHLYTRRYPAGLLALENRGHWAYGYVYWGSERKPISYIIWHDGTLEKVKKQ